MGGDVRVGAGVTRQYILVDNLKIIKGGEDGLLLGIGVFEGFGLGCRGGVAEGCTSGCTRNGSSLGV